MDDDPLSSFQGRSSSASSFKASLLQAIDGVMSQALCPKVASQASQHFRPSENQATCEGCSALQSVCSVISLPSGMSRAVHPQEFSKVDVDHRHIPVMGFLFHFSLSTETYYWVLVPFPVPDSLPSSLSPPPPVFSSTYVAFCLQRR